MTRSPAPVAAVGRPSPPARVSSRSTGAALAVSGLGACYGSRVVLREVSFAAGWGELIAVIGPNGAGKSTLFKTMAGLLDCTGRIALAGETCHHGRNPVTSYLPQRADIDPDFPISVEALVLSGRRRFLAPWRRPRPADRAAVADALGAVGLRERARDPIGWLSGGQLQRAFLARALASQARVLLLDEALSGVDAANTADLIALLSGLAGQGRTVLVATHDFALTRKHFGRCLAINGTLVADGPPAEVLTLASLEATFGSAPHAALS